MNPSSPGSRSCFTISPRTVLRLSGPDRLRYLNGQITQDVHLATGDRAVFGCILNAKGQVEAVCHVREDEESFLIDAPRELREDLLARLDRYIIADDVTLTDESDEWHIVHQLEATAEAGGLRSWSCTRLSQPGIDLFSRDPLSETGMNPEPETSLRNLRIAQGLPNWGAEITRGALVPELLLESEAISYEKGCYIGQEVVSRMKRAGKTNRILVALEVSRDCTAPCGLFLDDAQVGELTSVSSSSDLEAPSEETRPALGFLRTKLAHQVREQSPEFNLRSEDGTPLPGWARIDPDCPGMRMALAKTG